MECSNCGARNENGAKFCARCGAPLKPERRTHRRNPHPFLTAGVVSALLGCVCGVGMALIML